VSEFIVWKMGTDIWIQDRSYKTKARARGRALALHLRGASRVSIDYWKKNEGLTPVYDTSLPDIQDNTPDIAEKK